MHYELWVAAIYYFPTINILPSAVCQLKYVQILVIFHLHLSTYYFLSLQTKDNDKYVFYLLHSVCMYVTYVGSLLCLLLVTAKTKVIKENLLPGVCLSAVVEEEAERSPGTAFSPFHTEPRPCQDAPLQGITKHMT